MRAECAFENCPFPSRARGFCTGHYQQHMKGQELRPLGTMAYIARLSFEERFWFYVEKTDSCWVWTGAITRNGYGQIYGDNRAHYAHRVSYELHKGPIPARKVIDHTCYNRACVNPNHLQAVTNKQNMENRPGPQRNSTTGVRGVHRKKGDSKFVASITHNKRVVSIGRFDTLEEAEAAVIAKRNELFTNNLLDRRTA